MISPTVMWFFGGLLVGLLAAWVSRKLFNPYTYPDPDINVTCLSGGMIRIDGTIGALPPAVTFKGLYVQIYDDTSTTVPDDPTTAGATPYSNFPIDHQLPGGLTPPDLVAVWAEFTVYGKDTATCECSGGSSGSWAMGRARAASPQTAAQLEAIPRAYRVSRQGPDAAALQMLGPLEADTLLHYVPEASTQSEPLWQAKAGADRAIEWTLRLLNGPDGFGAVLSVRNLRGDREARFSWVTSRWRFHVANRLIAESDDAGALALIVSPA